jgi:hypothetical protein
MTDRQDAYLELVRALLECEGGTEADILEAHPELVDEKLVMTLLGVVRSHITCRNPYILFASQNSLEQRHIKQFRSFH